MTEPSKQFVEMERKANGDEAANKLALELEAREQGIALLASLDSAYADFSDGGKWAFGSAYNTVVNHIKRGDIAAAKLTVQMIIIPAEVPDTTAEQLATWSAKKTEILALFP